MSIQRDIICFPEMHVQDGTSLPSSVKLFDPGLGNPADERLFMPDGLPLTREHACGWLNQTAGLAELYRNPGDLRAQAAAAKEDFYSGTTMDITSELLAMENMPSRAPKEKEDESALKAQGVLLLAWLREQHYRELSKLDNGLDKAWEAFDSKLGLDPDDRDELEHLDANDFTHLGGISIYGEGDSWKHALEAMLRLLPKGAVLFVRERFLMDIWKDAGLQPVAAGDEYADLAASLGEGVALLCLTAPGYELSGRSVAPEGREWLAEERTVILAVSEE